MNKTFYYKGYDVEVEWAKPQQKGIASNVMIIDYILKQPSLKGMGFPQKGSTIKIKVFWEQTHSGEYKYELNWEIVVKNKFDSKLYGFEL